MRIHCRPYNIVHIIAMFTECGKWMLINDISIFKVKIQDNRRILHVHHPTKFRTSLYIFSSYISKVFTLGNPFEAKLKSLKKYYVNTNSIFTIQQYSVTNWLFLYWPWYRFEVSSIGPEAHMVVRVSIICNFSRCCVFPFYPDCIFTEIFLLTSDMGFPVFVLGYNDCASSDGIYMRLHLFV
jgi:hypothetical protein